MISSLWIHAEVQKGSFVLSKLILCPACMNAGCSCCFGAAASFMLTLLVVMFAYAKLLQQWELAAFLGYEMGYACDHLTPGVGLCCYWLFSPCRAEGGMRRGNMGHLTRIANAVVQNMEKGPMQTQISEFIKGIISFLHSIVFSLLE